MKNKLTIFGNIVLQFLGTYWKIKNNLVYYKKFIYKLKN